MCFFCDGSMNKWSVSWSQMFWIRSLAEDFRRFRSNVLHLSRKMVRIRRRRCLPPLKYLRLTVRHTNGTPDLAVLGCWTLRIWLTWRLLALMRFALLVVALAEMSWTAIMLLFSVFSMALFTVAFDLRSSGLDFAIHLWNCMNIGSPASSVDLVCCLWQ